MPAARAADRATRAPAALGTASRTLAPCKVSGPPGTRVTLEKVDGDHASWRTGGGAQATRALLLADYFWAQLA